MLRNRLLFIYSPLLASLKEKMDFDKTHKIWTDFTSKYNLELKDIDQHLIFVPKQKTKHIQQ